MKLVFSKLNVTLALVIKCSVINLIYDDVFGSRLNYYLMLK